MSQTTREEILEGLRRRYRTAGPEHKRKLLDQAQELLGYHRKSAVRALGAPPPERAPWINTGRPVSYDPKVLLPWLRPIWQATDYACGRRLAAMLPEWIPAYEAHERRLPSQAREKLLAASARTLDRLLEPLRHQGQGRRAQGRCCGIRFRFEAVFGMRASRGGWRSIRWLCAAAAWPGNLSGCSTG